MAYKIKVMKDICIGCGACASICSKAFEVKEGKAYAKKSKTEKLTCEKLAEENCPVRAISVSKE